MLYIYIIGTAPASMGQDFGAVSKICSSLVSLPLGCNCLIDFFWMGSRFPSPSLMAGAMFLGKNDFFPELPDINIPILVVVNAYIRVIRDNHQYVASIHLLGFYIARPGEEEGPREIPRPSLKLEQLRQFGR